jgi:predicted enzyme related to lactoylglutathione lyase
MSPIASLSVVALDCPDPRALAGFYGAITGWSIDHDDGEWVSLASDGDVTLAFQLVANHVPPSWPGGSPQQVHLDFDVDDLDLGEERVVALGAVKADVQPQPDEWRVFLDPAGHPFCLVLEEDDEEEDADDYDEDDEQELDNGDDLDDEDDEQELDGGDDEE